MKKYFIIYTAFLGFLLLISKTFTCSKETTSSEEIIVGPISICPDKHYAALRVKTAKGLHIIILNLKDLSKKPINTDIYGPILGMAWHPDSYSKKLFILTSGSVQRAIMGNVVNETFKILFLEVLPENQTFVIPAWNPAGDILACRVTVCETGNLNGVFLGLSYDMGRNFIIQEVPGGQNIWGNDSILYVNHRNQVYKVNLRQDGSIEYKRFDLALDDNSLPIGVLEDKLVHSNGSTIFIGNQLLCSMKQKVFGGIVSEECIGFHSGDSIYIINKAGEIIDKTKVDKNTSLITFSIEESRIYVRIGDHSIGYYNISSDKEIKTIF